MHVTRRQSQRQRSHRPSNPRDALDRRAAEVFGDLLIAIRHSQVARAGQILRRLSDEGYRVETIRGTGGYTLTPSGRTPDRRAS